MNTKYKTPAASAVPRSLGRTVGVLPLPSKPALPASQRKGSKFDRRQLKRTPSTGSLSSLNSARSVQSNLSNVSSRSYVSAKTGTTGKDGEDDEGVYAEIEQDVKFIDVDSNVTSRPSSIQSQRNNARTQRKTLSTEEILDLSQESDPYKVYEIDLHGTDLTQVPDLEKFRKLRVLDISGNKIKKIANLDFNKDLKDVKLYDNEISVIEGFDNLKDVCNLQLQHNQITCIGKGLSCLKKLQSVRLDNNKISRIDTPELLSCANITTLDLSNNRLETLAPLSYLPKLEELNATSNCLVKLGDLNKCKKLQEIDLSRNRLADLSGISNLPNLQILHVSENQLTSLSTVGKLRCLEELNINANRISELSSFNSMFPKLQILFACDNMIIRWNEICSLTNLPDLVELYVSANPFTMEDGDMPSYHLHVPLDLPNLEVIDGALIKRHTSKPGVAPVMRPMSASSIITVRQVDSQLTVATAEQETLQRNISDRFESLRGLFNTLPSEAPKWPPSKASQPLSTEVPQPIPVEAPQPTASSITPVPSSRCSSRLRIKEALQFAAVNFESDDDDGGADSI